MSETDCEMVRMSVMATRDGETATLSPDQIAVHLHRCVACQDEVDRLGDLTSMLDRQTRREYAEDLWPRVAAALDQTSCVVENRRAHYTFAVLSILLVACKSADKVPGLELPLIVTLAPVALVGAAFCWLRANPFRINPELELAGSASQ